MSAVSGPGRPSLDAIGVQNGTDKASDRHDYLGFYAQTLEPMRNDVFTFIEIGVHRGKSIATWGEYFSNATVVGLDISPDANVPVPLHNTHIRIGDATKLEFLDQITAEFGAPRVVLDDGSHYWHEQIETLRYLWPKVLPGGYYILEDLHTSFPEFAKNPLYRGFSKVSGYDYLLKINAWMVGNRAMASEIPDDGFIASYWPTFRSMHWYRGTCIMQKQVDSTIRKRLQHNV